MVKDVCRDYLSLLEQGTPASRRTSGTAKGKLGQVYDSIRVRLRAIPSVPLLSLQDLRNFVAPSDGYIPGHQTNLTIEEIVAAHSPPSNRASEDRLDDSEPRLLTRTSQL